MSPLGVLVAILLSRSISPSVPDSPISLHRSVQTQAWIFARYLIAAAHSTVDYKEIRVSIESLGAMPAPAPRHAGFGPIVARTTRPHPHVRGCTLHLSTPVYLSASILAHEVCHCVLENDLLDDRGYKPETSAKDIDLGERFARECAEKLVEEVTPLAELEK